MSSSDACAHGIDYERGCPWCATEAAAYRALVANQPAIPGPTGPGTSEPPRGANGPAGPRPAHPAPTVASSLGWLRHALGRAEGLALREGHVGLHDYLAERSLEALELPDDKLPPGTAVAIGCAIARVLSPDYSPEMLAALQTARTRAVQLELARVHEVESMPPFVLGPRRFVILARAVAGMPLAVGTLAELPAKAPLPDFPWLLCDGRELSRIEERDLFAVIGVEFGDGDGETTYQLPDLREDRS